MDTDEETGTELVRLAVTEARAQRSTADVTPVAVLRHLVTTALSEPDPAFTVEELAVMTDDELLGALRRAPATAEEADVFRLHPLSWQLLADPSSGSQADVSIDVDEGAGAPLVQYQITRSYLDVPTVDGELLHSPDVTRLHGELPLFFALRRVCERS